MYLSKFTHSPEVWARMLAHPEDRRLTLGPLLESVGGRLHGYWYALGDADGYILFEAPGDVAVASIAIRAASTGAFATISTTKLLTVEETFEALGLGGDLSYRPPGGPGR